MNLARWQRIAEWPLAVAGLAFLVAYSWEVIANLSGWQQAVTEAVQWATWAAFFIDYVVSLGLARERVRWFLRHLLDLLSVVLPFLRPLRVLRLVNLLSALRRGTGRAFRGRVMVYVVGATILLIWITAVAMLDAERGQGGTINTLPDAIWWAFVTITTVGYGDVYPVTALGRAIAVVTMIGGVALIGVVTATLASWIVERVSADNTALVEKEEATITLTRRELAALTEQIQALRDEVGRTRPPLES